MSTHDFFNLRKQFQLTDTFLAVVGVITNNHTRSEITNFIFYPS
jgi:hypothetical protein